MADSQELRDALQRLVTAAECEDWATVLGAATEAKLAVDELVREEPDLPASLWVGSDNEYALVRLATQALGRERLDIAVRLLDVIAPGSDELDAPHAALVALQAGDPELAVATLVASFGTGGIAGALRQRIAGATATTLDRGDWEHRMLAVWAAGVLSDDAAEDAYDTRKARVAEWTRARNLHAEPDLLDYVLVTMCGRRRESQVFEACATKRGERMAVVAPWLFDKIATAARVRLAASEWSWSAFSIVALADVLAGRRGELDARVAKLVAERPNRARLINSTVERVGDHLSPGRGAPRPLAAPDSVATDALGTFEIESSVLTVGDPGYTNQCLHFHRVLVGARPGTWRAMVVRSEARCVLLVAHHVAQPCRFDEPIWSEEGSIDVEYGTAGIFDCAHYYDENISRDLPTLREGEHPWFDLCIVRAHGWPGPHHDRGGGVIPYGCVSVSGAGDGDYTCYSARAQDGDIVGVCLDFELASAESGLDEVVTT